MSYTESPMRSTDISASKVKAKLEGQRGKANIDLSDSFIGDEGCAIVAQFVLENPNVQQLDLKGNNIGMEGISQLASCFRAPCKLKVVSLEWNNVGVVDAGVDALADALAGNKTVTSLDLRNNRIGPEGASSLANLLKQNSTLERFDLRWNELGPSGGKALLAGAQANRGLQNLELSGNKIPEDILEAIAQSLGQSARPSTASLGAAQTPVESGAKTNTPGRYVSPGPMKKEDLSSGRYNAQVLAHSRTETKIAELEMLLDQERRKYREIRHELIQELEQEKTIREHTEENLLKLKEDSMRKEMIDINAIEDLEAKINNLTHEKNTQMIQIANEKEEIQRTVDFLNDKNASTEERIAQVTRELSNEEEMLRSASEKLKAQQQLDRDQVETEWDRKSQFLEDQYKKVVGARDELKIENQRLEETMRQIKAGNEESLNCQSELLRDEENRRIAHHDNLQGSKIDKINEGRGVLENRVGNLENQYSGMETRHAQEMAVLEQEADKLKEEKNDLQSQIQQLESGLGQLHGEVELKEQTVSRLDREKGEFTENITRKKNNTAVKVANIKKDSGSTKGLLTQGLMLLTNRNKDLENTLRNVNRDIANVKAQHETLISKLNTNLEETLNETLAEHMKMVEASIAAKLK